VSFSLGTSFAYPWGGSRPCASKFSPEDWRDGMPCRVAACSSRSPGVFKTPGRGGERPPAEYRLPARKANTPLVQRPDDKGVCALCSVTLGGGSKAALGNMAVCRLGGFRFVGESKDTS